MNRSLLPRVPRLITALLAFSLLGAGLTACSPAENPEPQAQCTAPGALVIIAAAHANASPGLPAESGCLIAATIDSKAPVSLVVEDGQPYVAETLARKFFGIDPKSDTYRNDHDKARNSLIRAVAGAEALTDGDDPLAAFALASDQLAGTTNPVIVVLTPGLSDQAPLNFTDPAMASADPAEVVKYLKSHQALPDLKGVKVIWSGNSEAHGAQRPLATGQKKTYRGIWAAVLKAAGATTTFVPAGAQETPKSNEHTIKPVAPVEYKDFVPASKPDPEVFGNESAVGFEPRTTTLRDPAAAGVVAKELADWLAEGKTRTLTITGTTASAGTQKERVKLSLDRANTFKNLIVEHGANPSRIRTVGAGNEFKGFIPDIRNGALVPELAEKNRTIRIDYIP